MVRIGDDDGTVIELDLVAGAAVHDLGRGHNLRGLAVGPDQLIANADLAHRRPSSWRWQRGVEREGLAHGGPGGYDDHLTGMQAVGEVV
jgi:hypothetical protein